MKKSVLLLFTADNVIFTGLAGGTGWETSRGNVECPSLSVGGDPSGSCEQAPALHYHSIIRLSMRL